MTQNNWEKDDIFSMLFTSVGAGNIKKTKEILNTHSQLADLSDPAINEDGILFGMAIKKSAEMLELLINTYVQTKLQGDPYSIEYLAARVKLKSMLEEQIDSSPHDFCELDEKIQEILLPWVPQDIGSETDEEDFSDLNEVFGNGEAHQDDVYASQEHQIPDFTCGWPDALLHHRHLSGDSTNGPAEVH